MTLKKVALVRELLKDTKAEALIIFLHKIFLYEVNIYGLIGVQIEKEK